MNNFEYPTMIGYVPLRKMNIKTFPKQNKNYLLRKSYLVFISKPRFHTGFLRTLIMNMHITSLISHNHHLLGKNTDSKYFLL